MKIKWLSIVEKLDYAFQPIIHSHSGKIFAVEALIRNVEKIPNLEQIHDLFDLAYKEDYLYQLDLLLRDKAIEKFAQIDIENLQLFYNLDNRIIHTKNYSKGNTKKILSKYNFDKNVICYELSERGTLIEQNALVEMIKTYKNSDYCIAIDDFGVGVSGLKLLYFSQANIIKIDRFFIDSIDSDSKKRLFCSSIINMAHIMGMKVVAEGVETLNEFYTCKNIGADFIQGYFVQKPTIKVQELKHIYKDIVKNLINEKRADDATPIEQEFIQDIIPLNIKSSLHSLFLYFKDYRHNNFVPIVDDYDNFMGVIYEVDIKQISYSQYGLSLAQNKSYNSKISKYVKPVISVESSWGIDKALEIFNHDPNSSGIFITKANKYAGFIDLRSLLQLSHKRNLEIAENQNPLTRLPGNKQIELFIYKSLKNREKYTSHILYFDFDNFKPFNDHYGFRQGDRAILLFSELLQKKYPNDSFVAHIGGDDFFIGIKNSSIEKVYDITNEALCEFKESAKNLYKEEDKQNGYIEGKDRFGEERVFKLLSCSCAIIEISSNSKKSNFDHTLNIMKKYSKDLEVPICASF
ncbi:GGDEF domain-containing protein [uncultured Arcobacter sp.]|uniref:GGDEF domain-containing protein n=1 Tax=uncultured Arcobacter sp. TaxID=165434 RepID=UPI00262C08EC|nr:GGDEF domain-containing protein [uncultured Arcobacter sp.]